MHKRNGLTALRVQRTRKPGRHSDGGGLHLAVSDTGATRGLGSADTVSLAEARLIAADARKAVHAGIDPRAPRTGTVTFGQVADQLFKSKSPEWTNAKHKWQWQRTLQHGFRSCGSVSLSHHHRLHIRKIINKHQPFVRSNNTW